MDNLILDENHHYHLDGREIESLTSTIKEAGLIRPGDSWYMTRGTALHLCTEYFDKGTLDESTVDPQIKGYLESWKRFRKDQNYVPTHIEYKMFNSELLVGTTVDRIPLLDIKTGSPQPWHILQVAFQWATLLSSKEIPHASLKKPMDVYLDPEGKSPNVKLYTLLEIKEAYKVYCSMLHYLRWKREKYGNNKNV